MASTYSQDNVGAGVDAIVSSPVNQPVRCSAVSETDNQLLSQILKRASQCVCQSNRTTGRQTIARQSVSEVRQSVRHISQPNSQSVRWLQFFQ